VRILFVDQYSALGGAQLCLRDLLIETPRRGWQAEVAAPGNGPLLAFCRASGIPSHSLPLPNYTSGRKKIAEAMRYGIDMSRAAWAIRGIVRRFRPELVYCNGPRVLPAAAAAGVPLVFHAHSYLDKSYSRRIVRACLRRSHATVIACCRFVGAGTAENACATIYNGVGEQGYLARPVARAAARIGIIGRIAPEKGHLDFIRAAKTLDARFLIFGAGLFSDPAYEAAVRSEAAGTTIEFRGWTDKVPEALREIDILAVPSAGVDATPRIILEAFSAGTPVVSYPSGGIPELIRDGETGLLTARPDHQALVQSIRRLVGDPDLMAKLSASGRREWERRFRVERFQRDVCDLLESRFNPVPPQSRRPREPTGAAPASPPPAIHASAGQTRPTATALSDPKLSGPVAAPPGTTLT
jgi:glycosyltransferase involved in cell wall biosynthesis